MNPALIEKAEEIFIAAQEIPSPEERGNFLERECRGNATLRSLVEGLLADQAEAIKFFQFSQEGSLARLPMEELEQSWDQMPALDEKLDALARPDEFVGKIFGSYKLLQKIGAGGCGAVYMAEQEKPVRRKVAFKIIKLGMDTKSVIVRFEAERQALALMDHPNIARVLDAGATETGRPFFVMELVRGVKITDYCDQNELSTPERLKLFIQVCHAIQHAHQKGVIHRDIKPSNILVTTIDGQPVPKVIDFGIAKAIEGRLTDNTIFTAYEQFIGTPAYMSPEQALMSGVDVDTRSDIYSLGVLLYELLTGRTPFETKELLEKGIDGLRRTLQEREPQRPSVMVTTLEGQSLTQVAQHRHAEPLKLISQLRGDLDWIVIRTLEKDRSRRYETANGLAMDVQRYLDNEPIVARPPSRLYRFQKMVWRNKATFGFGATVALVLMGWVGTATWLLHQEREARKRAVAAEQQQTQLRLEAEDRERITQAAFLISQGKNEAADELVGKVSAIKPSLEAESVLRELGIWHVLKGRWSEAAARFKLLLEADQKDKSKAITDDLLQAGPVLIECGDRQGYEQFRRAAVEHFLGTTDPVFAERTLKISLLIPAPPDMMKSLETFSELSANSIPRQIPTRNSEAWRCISLALMAYRQDFTPTAKAWCQKVIAYRYPAGETTNDCRTATAHVIQAMACYQLGETSMAQAELAEGRSMIQTAIKQGSLRFSFWFDWLFARILLREAETLVEKAAPDGK